MNQTRPKPVARGNPPPSVLFSDIPGLTEALARAREKQARTRENSLLNLTYDLCGVKVRTMTVLDYVLLDRNDSPFLRRIEPTMSDLAFFLWTLSPAFAAYTAGAGWRRWFPFCERLEAFFHGRKIRRAFGINPPESSEPLVVAAFDYVSTMFYDCPAAGSGRGESCLSFLTGWFDAVQSEYHFSSDQVWQMGMPELFQRLKAIQHRHNPNVPEFNQDTDAVKAYVLRGLRANAFSMEDLKAGRVKMPDRFSKN